MAKLSVDEISTIHEKIVTQFKITNGIINKGILESIIERPDTQIESERYVYNDIFSKAASLLEGIIRWHPFADGNKRTALVTTIYYLKLEGYAVALPLSAIRYTVNIAKNEDTDSENTNTLIKEIAKWLRNHSDKDPKQFAAKLFLYLRIPYSFLMFLEKIGFKNYVLKKVSYWMAFDIYPEYVKEANEIIDFIQETLNSSVKAFD